MSDDHSVDFAPTKGLSQYLQPTEVYNPTDEAVVFTSTHPDMVDHMIKGVDVRVVIGPHDRKVLPHGSWRATWDKDGSLCTAQFVVNYGKAIGQNITHPRQFDAKNKVRTDRRHIHLLKR